MYQFVTHLIFYYFIFKHKYSKVKRVGEKILDKYEMEV